MTAMPRGPACSAAAPSLEHRPRPLPPEGPPTRTLHDGRTDHGPDAQGLCALGADLRRRLRQAHRTRGRAAVEAAMACGPRVLEAGVGTGLSLGYYLAH